MGCTFASAVTNCESSQSFEIYLTIIIGLALVHACYQWTGKVVGLIPVRDADFFSLSYAPDMMNIA